MIDYLFMRENGIYSIPLMVMATYIFLFILFGAILVRSGAGRFFINVALALTGSKVGGPAKASQAVRRRRVARRRWPDSPRHRSTQRPC